MLMTLLIAILAGGIGYWLGYSASASERKLEPANTGMNDFELVFHTARTLEQRLRSKYPLVSGTAVGLHGYITQVQRRGGPDKVVRQMRFLATVRNRLAHDPDFRLNGKTRKQFYYCREAVKHAGFL